MKPEPANVPNVGPAQSNAWEQALRSSSSSSGNAVACAGRPHRTLPMLTLPRSGSAAASKRLNSRKMWPTFEHGMASIEPPHIQTRTESSTCSAP